MVQAFVGMERMLIAENLNRQAGPGGLCEHNMGEQILFETGAFRGAFSVASVSGRELHVNGLEGVPAELLGSRFRGDGGQSELWPVLPAGSSSGQGMPSCRYDSSSISTYSVRQASPQAPPLHASCHHAWCTSRLARADLADDLGLGSVRPAGSRGWLPHDCGRHLCKVICMPANERFIKRNLSE